MNDNYEDKLKADGAVPGLLINFMYMPTSAAVGTMWLLNDHHSNQWFAVQDFAPLGFPRATSSSGPVVETGLPEGEGAVVTTAARSGPVEYLCRPELLPVKINDDPVVVHVKYSLLRTTWVHGRQTRRTRAMKPAARGFKPGPAAKPRARSARTHRAPEGTSEGSPPPAPSPSALPSITSSGPGGRPTSAPPAPARPLLAGASCSTARSAKYLGPARVLDHRLLPVAHALAELLLADLLKYPPKA